MYDQSASAVTAALTSTNAEVFDANTLALITGLTTGSGDTTVRTEALTVAGGNVTVPAGTELAFIQTSNVVKSNVTVQSDVKVVLFQGAGGVNATFNEAGNGSAAGTADRVVVGTAAADRIVISDAQNTQITAGGGDTVVAGAGADTIVAGLGNSTIEGGTGFAIVQLAGSASDYQITVVNGDVTLTGGNNAKTTISGIQFIQLDNGNALVLAKDNVEAAVTALYEATFGRSADAYGLDFWFDAARAGATLDQIADAFVNSAEYKASLGTTTNDEFVNTLFKNVYGRDASADDLAFYSPKLADGTVDRGDVIVDLVEAVVTDITDGGTAATIVGGIQIVNGIV
jgi:hypothetical protein